MALPESIQFTTARLCAVPAGVQHIDDLLAVNGDEAVTRFLPYSTWATREDGLAWLSRMNALAEAGATRQLVLMLRDCGRAIGTLLLFKHDEASRRLEVGYVLGRAHWGRGYMHEALAATCGHAFGELSCRRLEAEVNPDNAASWRVLERLGFQREGRLRQRWTAKGRSYDTLLYGLLADDPRPGLAGTQIDPQQGMRVALLTTSDAPRYRDLMLEAYAQAADAFTSTAAERAAEPPGWWEQRIASPDGLSQSFGAFAGDRLVGTVALEYSAKPKTCHSALVLGMYVQPSARRRHAGMALLQAAVAAARARPGIEVLRLTVTEGNEAAIRLYRALGFSAWGVEPQAIRTAGGFRGKVHMCLRLGDGTGPG